jgi:hypothetical protein
MEKEKRCVICGELLTGQKRKYCSEKCQKKGRIEANNKYREKNREKVRNISRRYKQQNQQKVKKSTALYYKKNKEKNLEYGRLYRKNNKEKVKETRKKYVEKNKEIFNKKNREYNKRYRENNKEKVKNRKKKYRQENKEKIKEYKNHPVRKLHENVSSSMRQSLKSNKLSKNKRKWEDLVGYTTQDLKEHLEKLFQPGMTWENYDKNGWNIDHIIPKVFFIFTNTEDVEFKICWRLENLMPLWRRDNREKSDKITLWKKEINARYIEVEYFNKLV